MISMEELISFKTGSGPWLEEGVDFHVSMEPFAVSFTNQEMTAWTEEDILAFKQEAIEELGLDGIRVMRDARNAEISAASAALKASARAKLVAGQPLTEGEAATVVL